MKVTGKWNSRQHQYQARVKVKIGDYSQALCKYTFFFSPPKNVMSKVLLYFSVIFLFLSGKRFYQQGCCFKDRSVETKNRLGHRGFSSKCFLEKSTCFTLLSLYTCAGEVGRTFVCILPEVRLTLAERTGIEEQPEEL